MPDTYTDAHVVNTAREAGAAANRAATKKNTKYSKLSNTNVFRPVAIETGVHGTIMRLIWYRRLEDGRPTVQLARCNPLFYMFNVLVPTGFVLVGQKIIIVE